ncbi:MAG: aminotransferase class III-fold pyridoxal phosphate-dependent enzyme, partial [Chloroflexi bacterium]
ANAAEVGGYLLAEMRRLAEKYPVIGDVRGKGLMIGMEFVEDRATKKPAKQFVADLIHEAYHNGLLLLPCGASTIRFMPPLMLSHEQAAEGIEIIDAAIQSVLQRR